jgi:hypothetical protein
VISFPLRVVGANLLRSNVQILEQRDWWKGPRSVTS